MVTGTLPFRGESPGVIFNAILERDPVSPVRLNPDIPVELDHIIIKSLEKDRDLRYQHVADMRTDLKRVKRDSESGRKAAASSDSPVAAKKPRGMLWKLTAPVVLLLALLAAGIYYFSSHHTRPLTAKDTIVISDFVNTTGDPVFYDTLKTALTVSLRQSPFLNILSDNEVSSTLQMMTKSGLPPTHVIPALTGKPEPNYFLFEPKRDWTRE